MTAEQKRVKTAYGLKHNPSMTSDRGFAFSYRKRGETVILGDNNMFWVLCFSDASKCLDKGLEKAM